MPAADALRLRADVIENLHAFVPSDRLGVADRDRTLAFLDDHPDGVDAGCQDGHVTATSLVLSADGRATLLTLHARIRRWIELGGHLEPEDADLAAAAAREGREESGRSDLELDPTILTVRVHENVPCRHAPGTTHFDVYHVLRSPDADHAVISDESLDLRWFDVDRLPEPLGDGVAEVLALTRRS